MTDQIAPNLTDFLEQLGAAIPDSKVSVHVDNRRLRLDVAYGLPDLPEERRSQIMSGYLDDSDFKKPTAQLVDEVVGHYAQRVASVRHAYEVEIHKYAEAAFEAGMLWVQRKNVGKTTQGKPIATTAGSPDAKLSLGS